MKSSIRNFIILIGILSVISISSCRKDVIGCTNSSAINYNPQANLDDGRCQYAGDATFWFSNARTDATVQINGLEGYITQYYPVEYPQCGSNGCANFTLAAGTYSYYAENAENIWEGTMTVYANQCSLILLN